MHVLVGRWATFFGVTCGVAPTLFGCSPLDVLGVEETVKQRVTEDTLRDDDIADKHPEYDPERTIVEQFGYCEMELNKSASVTRLSLTALKDADAPLAGRVFRTRKEALAALGERVVVPSMEVVNGALKPFNDGLYAAVELAAEDGSVGSPVSKAALFEQVLAALLERAESGPASDQAASRAAAAHFAAAVSLGGGTPAAPSDVRTAADSLVAEFLDKPIEARPIGFYTWQPALGRIFQRDRFLQWKSGPTDFEPFAATALVLSSDAALGAQYAKTLDLYAGLTNPFFDQSPLDVAPHLGGETLSDLGGIETRFRAAFPNYSSDPMDAPCASRLGYLPGSDSPETKLMRDIRCSDLDVPGANLIDQLIEAIRSGAVDLTPAEGSGWYDRQLYALETLLLPERAKENQHLLLTKEYKEKLVETFKSIITQTRETHVKQLGPVAASGMDSREVDLYPLLPVEPFPTFYLRTARAYAFLRLMLEGVMGEPFLEASARVLETGGRSPKSLGAELDEKAELLYGLHVVAARSLGMRHEITADELLGSSPEAAEAAARAWLERWRSDADVLVDPRVIVPVSFVGSIVTSWAVIGVKVLRMHASFVDGHGPAFVSSPTGCSVKNIVPYEPYLLVEQMVEVTRLGDPLTRDEFRAICDQHETVEKITEALTDAP